MGDTHTIPIIILASDHTRHHHLLDVCVAHFKVAHFICLVVGTKTGLPESVCGDPFRIFVCSTQRNKMWMTKKRSYVSLRGIKEDEVRSELSREGWTTDRNGTNWKSWERRKQNLWAERNSSKLSLKKIERTTVEEWKRNERRNFKESFKEKDGAEFCKRRNWAMNLRGQSAAYSRGNY